MADRGLSERDRILHTAMALFAQLGYDQTTGQMIADAAGLPVSAVNELFGSKRELYLTIISLIHEQEKLLVERMFSDYTHDRAGVHRLIDHYLDFFLEYPQSAALWMHRRMYDAADLRDIEKYYSFPQIAAVSELTGGLFPESVDIELVVWSIVWSVQTFVYGGIPDAHGNRLGRTDRRTVVRFRRHLHTTLDLLMLPGV